jgi:uncharacterized membrane protein YhaH (DUF805 family)
MSAVQVAATGSSYTPPSLIEFLFSFQGRVSRYQYWVKYYIPYALIYVGLMIIDLATDSGLFAGVFLLVTTWPSLAIGVKRCHDRDRSGWYLLLCLIPIIGGVWLFVELGCLRGTIGGNRFGPDPVSAR